MLFEGLKDSWRRRFAERTVFSVFDNAGNLNPSTTLADGQFAAGNILDQTDCGLGMIAQNCLERARSLHRLSESAVVPGSTGFFRYEPNSWLPADLKKRSQTAGCAWCLGGGLSPEMPVGRSIVRYEPNSDSARA